MARFVSALTFLFAACGGSQFSSNDDRAGGGQGGEAADGMGGQAGEDAEAGGSAGSARGGSGPTIGTSVGGPGAGGQGGIDSGSTGETGAGEGGSGQSGEAGGSAGAGQGGAGGLLVAPVAHYPFAGNAEDVSGNANHGSVVGATLVPDRFDAASAAYGFDGVDDYISVPNSASLNPLSELTLSAWLYFASYPPVQASFVPEGWWSIVNKHGSYILQVSGTYGFILTVVRGADDFPGLQQNSALAAHVLVQTWTHVAVTYDAATQQGVLYIDGEAKSWTGRPDFGTPTGLQSSNDELLIGAEVEPIEQFFNGRIDDVRIYDEALTASEIQALAADAP